ncbi:MAG: carbonic anhydrase [Gammaproteobacteria bacterium]|nr:carbonic anhydrase [Gammaproteobacteria bacterium]
MIDAVTALKRLEDGNTRFINGLRSTENMMTAVSRQDLTAGQQPFAIILGCSDSRVPAEIVFDQGLGDLFVIRVAGNVVAPSQIGSVEFAASQFNTRLVVVLGHTHCGAIAATINTLKQPDNEQSQNIKSIVDRIRPSIEALKATELWHNETALIEEAVKANIKASVKQLRQGSTLLQNLIANQGLKIVGAEYSLKTGKVEFIDIC